MTQDGGSGKTLEQLEQGTDLRSQSDAGERAAALAELAKAQAEYNDKLKETKKLQAEINADDVSANTKADMEAQVKLLEAQNEKLKENLDLSKKDHETRELTSDLIEKDLEYLEKKRSLAEKTQKAEEDAANQVAITDDMKKANAKQILDIELAIVKAKVENNKSEEDALLAQRKKLRESADFSKKELESLRAAELLKAKAARRDLLMENAQKTLQGIASVTSRLVGVEIPTSIDGLVGMFADAARAWDQANVNLMRTTGGAMDLEATLKQTAIYGAEFGGDFESASEAIGGAAGEFALFFEGTDAAANAARADVAKLATVFEKLGVESAATGKSLDVFTRSLGYSTQEALAATKDFDTLAQKLRLPTSVVIKDFNEIGPKMAKFGKDGRKEFMKLATEARKLGIATSEAFELSEQFSTFEGAADVAGQLNAQLGLQLNSVELLRAKDADRIKILRAEFQRMGKSWDDMGRFEKRAVTDMLGGDEALAKAMLGPTDAFTSFNEKQKEAEERAYAMTTAMDSFKGAMTLLWVELEPYLKGFTEWLKSGAALDKMKILMTGIGAGLGVALMVGVKSLMLFTRTMKLVTYQITMMRGGLDVVNKELAEAGVLSAKFAAMQERAANATARMGSSRVGGGLMSAGKGISKLGMGGGMVGMMGGHFLDSAASGMDHGAGRTATSMAGKALSYGSTGAMMGSMFGPIGTAIGGIGGALMGLYQGYAQSQENAKEAARTLDFGQVDDFIAIDGKIREFRKDDIVAGGTNLMGAAGMTGTNQPAMAIDYDKLGSAIVSAIGRANKTQAKGGDTKVVLKVNEDELGETVIKYINGKYDMVLGKK
jgi:hypothetical protein